MHNIAEGGSPRGLPRWRLHLSIAKESILQAEVEFFEANRFKLLDQAAGKYVLIKGAEIKGIYETELEAVRAGYEILGNQAFLVKHIVEADVPLTFTSFNLGI
jgi:hypothetical protein